MSHGGPFVSQEGQILYGYGYPSQTITFTGEPVGAPDPATGGSVTFAWGRHKATSAVTWSAGLTAATVQTALRTIFEFSDCTVTKSTNFIFTVDNSPAPHSTPALLYVCDNSLTGGTRPYVSITGTKVPLVWKGKITTQNATPVADKLNVGTDESTMTKLASQWDIRAPLSLGRRELKEREDVQRMWDGNAITFIENQITKPFALNAPSAGARDEKAVLFYAEVSGTLMRMILDSTNPSNVTYLSKFTDGSPGSWTDDTNPIDFPADASVAHISWNGRVYYTAASGYGYSNTSFTANIVYPADSSPVAGWTVYDGKLVRIQQNSQLGFTSTSPPAAEADWTRPDTAVINDGSTPLGLVTFADAFGESAIYALTTTGLWRYDFESALFSQVFRLVTTVPGTLAAGNSGNQQMAVYGDSLYIASGGTLYKFQSNGTVSQIGPWVDQGLPTASYIISLRLKAWSITTTNNWLLVNMSSETTLPTTITKSNPGSTPTHNGMVLGYNGQGWYVISGPYADLPQRASHYSSLFATPKLFLGTGRYILFNDAIGNPLYWSTQTYEDTGTVITPWFDAAVTHIQHTALMGHIWCRNFTSTSTPESVKIYYQLDDCQDSTSTNIGYDPRKHWVQVLDETGAALNITKTTLGGHAGLRTFFFDRQSAPDANATKFSQGVKFYKIRFRMDLSGGDAATNTPVVQFLSLQYTGQYPSTEAFAVRITLENNIGGRTAQMQLNDFRLLHDIAEAQPFAWQDSTLHVVREMNYSGRDMESGYLVTGRGVRPTIVAVFAEQSVELTEH